MSNNPYVFISYAHMNSDIVLPCIDALKENNVNLWFDEGIQAGSEWPEYIAEKVMHCEKFVLFISKAYLESQNCKRELNFAISKKKDILSIFIEDVELSPGVEMQLGTYQSIFRNRFATVETFHASICGEQWFDVCKTTNNAQSVQPIPVAQPMPSVPPVQVADTAPTHKKRIQAALFAFFLGSVGVHKFCLHRPWIGVLYIVLFLLSLLLFAGPFVTLILGVIDGILLLCMKDEAFHAKYMCEKPKK